jgi:hypothetical protein
VRALTIWQPWASLILIGAKPYEFRPKPFSEYVNQPAVGERVAIHAGARPVRRTEVADLVVRLKEQDPDIHPCLVRAIALPFLERVLLGLASSSAVQLGPRTVEPFRCPLSAVLCTVVLGRPRPGDECARDFGRGANDSDRDATFNWGWPLQDIEPVVPPVETSGAQGFWRWQRGAS